MCSQTSCQFFKNVVVLEPGAVLTRYVARGPPVQIVNPPHWNALKSGLVGRSGSFVGLVTAAFTMGGPFGVGVAAAVYTSGGSVAASHGPGNAGFGSAGPCA